MTAKPAFLVTAALCIAAASLACSRPLLLLPGGALEGEPAPIPESWAFTEGVDTVQLETRPGDPYSVNIWTVAVGDHLYVHAGTNRSAWVEHIEANPEVRMQVEDRIYALSAARVETQEEFDRFSDAYEAKYDRRPRNENVDEAYLFRLSAREG
jgi:hypothetical protein